MGPNESDGQIKNPTGNKMNPRFCWSSKLCTFFYADHPDAEVGLNLTRKKQNDTDLIDRIGKLEKRMNEEMNVPQQTNKIAKYIILSSNVIDHYKYCHMISF